VSRADKILLVLFSGRRGDAFMPICRMLARLPLGKFDILKLRPEIEGEYPRGVPGIGDSFLAVCQHIRTLAAEYGGGATLGTSLGGFAALRAARLSGLGIGVSLSGRFTLFRPDVTALDVPAFDPLCPCTRAAESRLDAYFSAENRVDTQNGAMLRTMLPGVRLQPVKNSQIHNVVAQLTATGGFDRIIQDIQSHAVRPAAA
jgi:hypothetical protein